MSSAENSANLFIQSEYADKYGRMQKEYLMTRDGFSLLVMGFTGSKALEWKLKYIEAFNHDEILVDAGYSPKAILSYLKCNGLIDAYEKGYVKTKRINKMLVHCVVLRVQEDIEINPFDEMGLL